MFNLLFRGTFFKDTWTPLRSGHRFAGFHLLNHSMVLLLQEQSLQQKAFSVLMPYKNYRYEGEKESRRQSRDERFSSGSTCSWPSYTVMLIFHHPSTILPHTILPLTSTFYTLRAIDVSFDLLHLPGFVDNISDRKRCSHNITDFFLLHRTLLASSSSTVDSPVELHCRVRFPEHIGHRL